MASDEAPPDTPRQPLSPYFHFAAEARKGITEPNLTPDGVNHKLQEMWNSLDTDARQVYERKAKEDQQRYKQEMSKYRNAYGW
ncbi:MAG: high mobility group box domain-containing protein [Piptocephalis tieghemiana]|nr:MAG: high mobility group box domain-containing protein [Piptocephalis tieghemiana]